MPWAKENILHGTNASQTDECLSTTISVLDDRRQAQHRKTAKVREDILVHRRRTIYDVFETEGLPYGTGSTHFGGKYENEIHFCEICAKTSER
jgi:hypothetical protein